MARLLLGCALPALCLWACIDLAPVADDPDADTSIDGAPDAAPIDASPDTTWIDASPEAGFDASEAEAGFDASEAEAGCVIPVSKTASVVAPDQSKPFAVITDSGEIWWSEESGSVHRANPDGSSAMTFALPAGTKGVTSLGVDATSVYMSAYYTDAIVRAPRAGGTAIVWAASQNGIGLALDAEHVYWPDEISSTVRRALKTATPPVSPQNFATAQVKAHFIALDATHVYWTTKYGGVRRKAKAGGNVETIADAPLGSDVWGLAVDDAPNGFVFWRDGNAGVGRVMRANKDGSSPTLLADGEPGPKLVALDATHVYWTNNVTHSVSRVPIAGGCKELLVTDQVGAHGIAVDATHVYWTNWTGGTVSRAAK
jgi:hypothetical protein